MLVLRPVQFNDLPDLEHLAVTSGGSMTTLPNNRDHLAELINSTQRSLQTDDESSLNKSYHFVLEDKETTQVVGISGIEACIGVQVPFYSYRCNQVEHYSEDLQIRNRIPTLQLCQDYEGSSRLCTFFLQPQSRVTANLLLLSLARMMFIGQHRQRFAEKMVVELQGVIDSDNQSPFWQALGQHFFNMEFHRANYLTGINAKSFIADLMPKDPVYIPLLAATAQSALGQVRPDMSTVKQLLQLEGFREQGYISIFDGGPTLEVETATLNSINAQFSVKAIIQEESTENQVIDNQSTAQVIQPNLLISNNKTSDYRCIAISTTLNPLELSVEQAKLLQVNNGDTLYVLPLAPYFDHTTGHPEQSLNPIKNK